MNLTFKKGIFFVLTMFSSQLFASSGNHFYVGGTLGVSSLADQESTYVPLYDKHTLGASGLTGGALVGYNFNLPHQWLIALEGALNVVSIDIADNQNYAPQSSYTVDMRYNAGVRILPTYVFSPTTSGHIILGYVSGGFKINDNGNYGLIHKTFSEGGLQTGVGMDTALSPCVDLRADVLYTNYGSQTSNGLTTGLPAAIQSYHNNLSTLEASLSVIYNI